MANTLRFKRGIVSTIPTAALGEPLFTTDTFDLYIGNGTSNTRFQKYIASGTTSQLLRGDGSLLTMPIVLTSPSNGQVLKYDGTNWVNSADAGITGSGTNNYITKWTSASTIGNSLLQEGTNAIGLGTSPVTYTVGARGINILSNTTTAEISIRNSTTGNTSGSGLILTNFGLNAYVINANAGFLALATSDSERMRITANGTILVNSTTDNGLRFQVTGDGFFSGSVGIGTSPSYRLHVVTAATATRQTLSNINRTTANWVRFTNPQFAVDASMGLMLKVFPDSDARQGAGIIASGGTNNGDTNLALFVSSGVASSTSFAAYSTSINGSAVSHLFYNGAGTTAMTLDVLGNLLVGSTSAASSTTPTNISIGSSFGTNTAGSTANIKLRLYDDGIAANHFGFGVSANLMEISAPSSIAFYNGASTSRTERMRLDASGNLGLGVVPSNAFTSARTFEIGANGVLYSELASSVFNSASIGLNYYFNASASLLYKNTGLAASRFWQYQGSHFWDTAPTGTANASFTFTRLMSLNSTGNLVVGSGADAGFRLDVNGTMRVSGASTFNARMTLDQSANIPVFIEIRNTSNGNNAGAYLVATSNNGVVEVAKYGSGQTTYKFLTANSGYIRNATAGDLSILNDVASGEIKMAAGASATPQFTIASTGAATFSSSVTANGLLSTNAGTIFAKASGTESSGYQLSAITMGYDATNAWGWITAGGASARTNLLIQAGGGNVLIGTLSNTGERLQVNGTMRVSGASNFGATLQITGASGTPTSGAGLELAGNTTTGAITSFNRSLGTFLPLVFNTLSYSFLTSGTERFAIANSGAATFSSTVRANADIIAAAGGAYDIMQSSGSTIVTAIRATSGGTNIMSSTTHGDNIAVGTESNTDLILASNNTERIRLRAAGHLQHNSSTAPTASSTDAYLQYSADIVAGNAAPHFRTENGSVIKLYQQDNSIAAANFVAGIGTSVTTLDAFDGYTIGQVVKALRNAGILS